MDNDPLALSPAQADLLKCLAGGASLRSHRYLDGRKIFKLHPLDGPPQTIRRATLDALRRQGLIDSNKKFPSAMFLLTEKGRKLVATLDGSTLLSP